MQGNGDKLPISMLSVHYCLTGLYERRGNVKASVQ